MWLILQLVTSTKFFPGPHAVRAHGEHGTEMAGLGEPSQSAEPGRWQFDPSPPPVQPPSPRRRCGRRPTQLQPPPRPRHGGLQSGRRPRCAAAQRHVADAHGRPQPHRTLWWVNFRLTRGGDDFICFWCSRRHELGQRGGDIDELDEQQRTYGWVEYCSSLQIGTIPRYDVLPERLFGTQSDRWFSFIHFERRGFAANGHGHERRLDLVGFSGF